MDPKRTQNAANPAQQPAGATPGGASAPSGEEKQPKVSLPKGGGAIQGIGEKFQVNPVTGTGSMSIPIAMSPGRAGFTPQLALAYDSGAGNSPFGLGWNIGLPAISRKTQKGLPRYADHRESDVFLLSGAEDLVPVIGDLAPLPDAPGYTVTRYRPRIEGLFARIEKWTHDDGSCFWKSITKDNITTIYGQSDDAKLFHPADAGRPKKRVFQWLIERTFDDRGNVIHYQYQKDGYTEETRDQFPNSSFERNRKNSAAFTQTYLKRVRYGNTRPYVSGGLSQEEPDWKTWQPANRWLFELVFDYGEHQLPDLDIPTYAAQRSWPYREDIFSSFRAGFDIRTYRLCHRVLMFHHFDELGDEPYLVRSTDLAYAPDRVATKLKSVTHTSYRKNGTGGYDHAELPALAFEYTQAGTRQEFPELPIVIENADADHRIGPLVSWGGTQLLDFNGDGLVDLHLKNNGAWYLAAGKGGGHFGPLQVLAEMPSLAVQRNATGQFRDLDGGGDLEFTVWSPDIQGYYPRTEQGHWKTLQTFPSQVNISQNDPSLRHIDVTGDGIPDLLLTGQDELVYYPSEGKAGYAAARRIAQALDEQQGPRVAFANPARDIYLADMTGDGLSDIVRIRSNAICYWPNQGYGQFGAKIKMANCPEFANEDQFNSQYLQLADIDGSGTTDIIYLGGEKIRMWHNEAGNGWSDPVPVDIPLPIDSLSQVQVTDFLGKGTAQLLWVSPTPAHEAQPLRYIDLMPEKPHLLINIKNNLGAETRLTYQPSTDFSRADKATGKPWITKLPFPVHVLTRQETYDHISKNSFVTRYAYHHGYYDRPEREFRGFGLVEQWDTEDFASIDAEAPPGTNWSEATDVPPVYTKTWFHTGAYIRRDAISTHYETEYYQKDADAWLLADTVLPPGLTAEENREACRALKGSLLRQEVYADDGTDRAEHPYTVTEANYRIQCLQQKADNRHGVFLVTPRENLTYHYERTLTPSPGGGRGEHDPRIAHTLNLFTDRYGNSTHALAIVYPRRGIGHPTEQQQLYATLSENLLLHPDDHADWYRHSLPRAARSFELHGLGDFFTGEKFAWHGGSSLKQQLGAFFKTDERGCIYPPEIAPDQVLDHSATPDAGALQLRLLAESRIKYLANDLTTVLPYGEAEYLESLAIPYEAYTLAFTQPILDQTELAGKITPTLLGEGGYRTSEELFAEDEARWWVPSGQTLFFYSGEAQTDRTAAERFYLPVGERTPLGQESYVWYDHHEPEAADSYWLFVEKATDPLENTLRMLDFDYRVLQARAMEDSNGNRSEVAFDIRGMVIASALRGKGEEGDELADFGELHCNPEHSYFDSILYPEPDEEGKLSYPIGRATTWFHYDVFAWQREEQPPFAIGLTRELHYHQPGGADSPIQRAVTYSDGFGREILSKVEAEDGNAPHYDAEGQLILAADGTPDRVHCTDRWVGNGRTIFNNKGKPVKQYEPFFDSHSDFTDEEALVYFGVTPVIHYDPLTRVIRTDLPDGTFSKVEFTPWEQITWDQNDTVMDSDWYHDRIGSQLGPEAERAARQTELHYETPMTIHLDTLGRPFVSIAHNRYRAHYKDADSEVEVYIPTHTFLDIEGNPVEIWDGRRSERLDNAEEAITYNRRGQAASADTGNLVMSYTYAMGGLQLFQNSMDAGRRWALPDVLGNPFYGWDERGHTLHTTYDALLRPTHLWVTQEEQTRLVEYLIYGEEAPDATAHNLRGQLYLHFDGAGLTRSESFDFKGSPLAGSRFLTAAYQEVPDWGTVSQLDGSTLLTELTALEQEEPTDLATWLDRKAYATSARFDALGRPVRSAGPDGSVQYPLYNKASLLEMVRVNVRGEATVDDETASAIRTHPDLATFVENIDYDAKGQRECIAYGNGSNTRYTYDAETFRLIRLQTTRSNRSPDGELRDTGLQDIRYHYDPSGNITEIYDDAQPTIFTANERVEPRHRYTYDALYQLSCATGRESRRITSNHPGHAEIPLLETIPIADGEVRNYRQHYRYDAAGNILAMRHVAQGGRWTRTYQYEEWNNRLLKAYKGAESPADPAFTYDAHGSMTTMPHLHALDWDYKDQLVGVQKTETGAGEVFCQYDSQRQRVRKAFVQDGITKERIYLGDYEIYRVDGTLELETLHITDDTQRIALIETPTEEPFRYRYQLANHLGSASIELDNTAEVITYEEYHPYGTSSFRARKSGVEVSAKRYRYTGMERDEETGLNYHTARYYLPWLGRWGSCDPLQIKSGMNYYVFVNNSPPNYYDPSGMNPPGDLDQINFSGIEFTTEGVRVGSFSQEYTNTVSQGYYQAYHQPDYEMTSPSGIVMRGYVCIGDECNPPPPEEEESSAWGLIVGGLLSIGAAFLILSNPVGWVAGLTAAFLLAGGVVSVGVGTITETLSATGVINSKEKEGILQGAETTAMLSSPGGLIGGSIGVIVDEDLNGLQTGALYGGFAEAGVSGGAGLSKMMWREYQFGKLYQGTSYNWTFSRNLKPAIRGSFGLPQYANRRSNLLFNWRGQNIEFQELSHFISQRSFLGRQFPQIFNRPWNLKPVWATQHSLMDPMRFRFMTQQFKAVYGSQQLHGLTKLVNRAPDWLQYTSYGFGKGLQLKLEFSLGSNEE